MKIKIKSINFTCPSLMFLGILLGFQCLPAPAVGADLIPGTPGVTEERNGTGGTTSGVLLTYQIPVEDWPETLFFEARGADGGHASAGPSNNTEKFLGEGGGGAEISARFAVHPTAANALRPGGLIRLIVGNRGESYIGGSGGAVGAAGGGGGTGVLYLPPGGDESSPEILMIAGGGGGGFVDSFLLTTNIVPIDGINASTSQSGTAGSGGGAYEGDLGGNGKGQGEIGVVHATGGDGFSDSGWLGSSPSIGQQGILKLGGWGSGGGGGSGTGSSDPFVRPGGGGGGGYSGGDGGRTEESGGGGGSFLSNRAIPGSTLSRGHSGSTRKHGVVRYVLGNLVDQTLPLPTVTLNGPALIELPLFGSYTEQGASAQDAYGRTLTPVISPAVDTSVLGDQVLTYTVTDEWGRSNSVTRTVRINQLPTQRLYVDRDATGAGDGSSWSNAFVHLQDALAAVMQPAAYEIWVAEGTYRPDQGAARTLGDVDASFNMFSNVAIYGGFAGTETLRDERDASFHPTILSGDLNGSGGPNSGDSRHVVNADRVNAEGILDGFIITSGNAWHNSTWVAGSSGGGMLMTDSSALIRNCIFQANFASRYGGGVALQGPCPGARFVQCRFEGNFCNGSGTAFAVNDGRPTPTAIQVIDCVFVGNVQEFRSGSGVVVYLDSHSVDFYNVLVAGNRSLSGSCMYFRNDYDQGQVEVKFFNSTVANNFANGGHGTIWVGNRFLLTMANSIVWGNGSGSNSLSFPGKENLSISNSLLENHNDASLGGGNNLDGKSAANNPLFLAPAPSSEAPTSSGDYRLSIDSPAVNAGSNAANPEAGYSYSVDLVGNPRIADAIIDLGAYETQPPIYVDATATGPGTGRSWQDAFTDLQDALAGVRDGGEIHIATGTYLPGTTAADTFRIQFGARIYGGYPSGGGTFANRDPEAHPVVLSGEIGDAGDWTDNVARVVTVDDGRSTLSQVVFDGVVVRDGYGVLDGGGIESREHLSLIHCRVEHNRAHNGGGVIAYQGVTLTIEDSVFTENEASTSTGGGGAVASIEANLTMRNCVLVGNRSVSYLGGGVVCLGGTSSFVNCNLSGNEASRGGALFSWSSTLTMESTLISGNRASETGGGLESIGDGSVTLRNVTFSGNAAGQAGGAINNETSTLSVENCLVWNNSAFGSTGDDTASIDAIDGNVSLRYCLLENHDLTSTGQGNLDGTLATNDPLFVTPIDPASAPTTAGNLRLQATSPVLHMGDNLAVSGSTDLDGNPRILGPAVDPGAYERAGVVYVDASATGAQTGLSWNDAFPTLQAALAFLNGAGAGLYDEVWMAEGSYVPDTYDFAGGPQGFPVAINVNLRGGFPAGGSSLENRDPVAHPSVLDATGTSGRVLTVDDGNDAVEKSVMLDGLVIRGGNTLQDGITPVGEARGGGIYSRENLTLRQVALSDNRADLLGGGLFLAHGVAAIENSTIRDNAANGRSISAGIGYAGGGLFADAGTVLTLSDSEILSNKGVSSNARGAGICVLTGSSISAVRCRFAGNHGINHGGALYAYQATLAFESCAFTGNTGRDGGAVYLDQVVSGDCTNCTFAGNAAVPTSGGTGDGGAMVISSSTVSVRNSVVWGNQSALAPDTATASILLRNGGVLDASYSLVQHFDLAGNGSGNLDATLPGNDALLVAPLDPASAPSEAGDFRLHLGSPCLDAGDSTLATSATDLAGDARMQAGSIDLGAYEGSSVTQANVHVFYQNLDNDFLNPDNWQSAGTPTPGAMAAGHFYIVPGYAQLDGATSLAGVLRVAPGGTLVLGAPASLTFDPGANVLVSGTLANSPVVTVPASASLDLAGGTLAGPVVSQAPIKISGEGFVSGALTLVDGMIGGNGPLTITGQLGTSGVGTSTVACPLVLHNTDASGRVLEIAQGTELENTGSVSFTAGEALVRGSWKHNQSPLEALPGTTIAGKGFIDGNLRLHGRLEPVTETGTAFMRVLGDLQCVPGCVMEFGVAGSGPAEFDKLSVSGHVEYGGELVVDFSALPLAQTGTYKFLTSGSGASTFATQTPVGLAPNRSFIYNPATPGQFVVTDNPIVIPGSATTYTTTDKDWLSHTTNDIDRNGLGSDGWLFFGNFDGVPESDRPFTHRVESLPSYVTSVVAGANFLSVADEYDTDGPGFGIIDDPTTLDGSDARSGAVVADGGAAGDSLEILSFTVSGLTTTVRVGILAGTEQRVDGRWDPTSITLSDGTTSATVGDHSTSPLPAVPDTNTPNNVGWVFFDIYNDGTYTISATKRLATQGVSIGGLTFDSAPIPQTFTFNATFDEDFFYAPNWTGSNGGTATPGNMKFADTYVVPVNAMLSGPATLSGNLVVNPAATLTMATGSQISGTGIITVNGRLKTSAGGTATIGAALVLNNTGAPGRVLDIVAGSVLQNTGSISLQAGEALVSGTWNHNQFPLSVRPAATLLGDGTLGGSLQILGGLKPGPESGTGDLTVQGYLAFIPGSTMEIEVAGSGAGQFDRVLSSGTAELAGALVVDFSDRPLADAGTYTFLTYGGKALSFGSVTPVGFAAGTGFDFDAATQAQFTITAAPSQTFTFDAAVDSDYLDPANWSGVIPGSATPANPRPQDIYLVAADAVLSGTAAVTGSLTVNAGASLTVDVGGSLTVNAGVTMTVEATGSLTLNGGADVVVADTGTLSNYGTVTCLAGTKANPTTLLTGINGGVVNQVGATFTRAGSFSFSLPDSELGGHFTNHGTFDETGGGWQDVIFDNSATGSAIIRAKVESPYYSRWNNDGTMTSYSLIGFDGTAKGGSGNIVNHGTLSLPNGSAHDAGTLVINTGTLNVATELVQLDNSGTVNLTGPTRFVAWHDSLEMFRNRASGVINQGPHLVTLVRVYDISSQIVNEGTWTGSGGLSFVNKAQLNLKGGTLTNNGSWAFSGDGTGVTIEVGGTLAGSATLAIPATASLSLTGGDLANTVTTAAPVSVTAGSTISGSLTLVDTDITGSNLLTVTGKLGAAGSGTSTVACDLSLSNPTGQVLEVAPGATLETTGAALSFSSGQASVRGVWNHHRPALQARGTVGGDGTIIGTTNFWNRIEPGPAGGIGDLTVDGNANLVSASAKLVIDAAGLGTGEFDRLVVTGNANFTTASSLEIDFSPRPRAVPGVYAFVVATTHSNSFGTQTPLALDASRSFTYDPANPGQFTITSTATPYEDWAAASGLTAGVNDDPFDDANLDGVLNIQHFAFDTHPLTSDGSHEGKRRVRYLDVGGTDYASITLPVRKGAGFAGSPGPSATVDGFIYSIQGSADLSAWTESVSEVTPADSAGLPTLRDLDGDGTPDWEYRTFILDDATLDQGFLRSGVQLVP